MGAGEAVSDGLCWPLIASLIRAGEAVDVRRGEASRGAAEGGVRGLVSSLGGEL